MINLNKNTKRAKHMVESYKNATVVSITGLYKNPSYLKEKAARDIFERYVREENTGELYFFNANSMTFCAGYLQKENNSIYLIYITYANTYKIDVTGVFNVTL